MPESPKRYETVDDGDFEVFTNVPVFDEHIGDDGVVYDKRILACIAQNNNDRIEDTGDYTPISAGHTPDRDKPDAKQPEIIGFAGPYHVSVIGNKKPRHVIVADKWRIFKEYADDYRRGKYPRRSVELWPEERPEDRFFDPIAVLGAETPRRALGLVYSKTDRRGKHPIRYEMAATVPGGSNTFLPDTEPRKHAQGKAMSNYQGEDIAQLAEALKPMIAEMIAAAQGGIAENEIQPEEAQEAEAAMIPDMQGGGGAGGATPAAPSAAPSTPEIAAPTAFSKYAREKLRKYAAMEGDEHEKLAGASKFMAGLDDDEKGEAMSFLSAGGDADDEADKNSKSFYSKLAYACGCGPDASEPEKNAMQYQKQASEWQQKYRKVENERKQLADKLAKVETDLTAVRAQEKYAKRNAAIDALEAEGYVIDDNADGEMRQFMHGLPDSQFEQFVALAPQRFQRVPRRSVADFAVAADRTPEDTKADKYASEAAKIVQQYRKEGKPLEFRDAMRNMISNNGKFNPEFVL
jgi:hypothetical protein